MILWHTDTDEFIPGQWIKGKVERLTMTSDGKHAAIGIMGYYQHIRICRPPYFAALEIVEAGLCTTCTSIVEDGLYIDHSDVYAENPCPLERRPVLGLLAFPGQPYEYVDHDPNLIIDATKSAKQGRDQNGRKILLKDGKVFELIDAGPQLLYDTSLLPFESVVTPKWAKQW